MKAASPIHELLILLARQYHESGLKKNVE
jgi:hypothetical protein